MKKVYRKRSRDKVVAIQFNGLNNIAEVADLIGYGPAGSEDLMHKYKEAVGNLRSSNDTINVNFSTIEGADRKDHSFKKSDWVIRGEVKDKFGLYNSVVYVMCDEDFRKEFQDDEDDVTSSTKTSVSGSTSDGYHTFDELYEFRKMYNALLFNEWAKMRIYNVHKSVRHHDGEFCFGGGWFIVTAELPTGQISNHYKIEDWDLFNVKSTPNALFPYDGHTPADTLVRMRKLAEINIKHPYNNE